MYTDLGYSLSGIEQLKMENIDINILAARAFESAYSRGRRGQLFARIFRRSNCLQDLASQPISSERSTSRIVSIPIRSIKGSLGRTTDFDRNFNPLQENSRTRWISILTAMLRNISLPPVELVKVGNAYYVRDGHHRISVALALGQMAIDARIVN
jgi:hypothetical protein